MSGTARSKYPLHLPASFLMSASKIKGFTLIGDPACGVTHRRLLFRIVIR